MKNLTQSVDYIVINNPSFQELFIDFLPAFSFAYLIGSIPSGLILTKIFGYGDIRNIGSGNIGATNVLRTGNKFLALTTLFLDAAKGAIAIFLLLYLDTNTSDRPIYSHSGILLIGFSAVLGHCFPVWLKFKGGKGVATTLGTLLAAVPITGIIACLTWLAFAALFRISSLSAIIALAVAPAGTLIIYGPAPAAINVAISALVIYRHHENIKRLLKGEEPKIGKKKAA